MFFIECSIIADPKIIGKFLFFASELAFIIQFYIIH